MLTQSLLVKNKRFMLRIGLSLICLTLVGVMWMGFHPAYADSPSSIIIKGYQKISDIEGNFIGVLKDGDVFGSAVAVLGDLDRDGTSELVVGAQSDNDGGTDRGAVWILFMQADGTVKNHQKISDTAGDFTGILDNDDQFGASITSLGDLDGDSVTDLAVGAFADDDGAIGQSNRGAVWILFMNSNGTAKEHQKISDTVGNFGGILANDDLFGSALANLGDLDGDNVIDLAVGAFSTDDGGSNRGAVWILFMNSAGAVKSQQKISVAQGGFTGILDDDDRFGTSVMTPGDLDDDNVTDLLVGAYFDDNGGTDRGAVWILFLNADGTVKNYQKISSTTENFTNLLNDSDFFGRSATPVGDLDNDGVMDVAVGASFDNDGGVDRGAVWILFLGKPNLTKIYIPLIRKECIFIIFGCI